MARRKRLSDVARAFKADLTKNQTNAEVKFKRYLEQLNIIYTFQRIVYHGNKFYIVDFYLPRENIVFEIDGDYHRSDEQCTKDDTRTKHLKIHGIKHVHRFKNKETDNPYTCKNRIIKLLSK